MSFNRAKLLTSKYGSKDLLEGKDIIYSEHKLWDQRLIKAFAEIENQYVLSSDYAHLSFDNDTFISENDFEKYGTSATA